MIYATGDTHGTFERFREEYFPEQSTMTKDDYVIICGDFGGVWDGGKQENKRLDWLEQLPFTVNETRFSNFFIEIRVAFCRKILIYQGFPVFAFWRSHRANVKIVKLFSFIKVAI